jgi:hypothetical protein
MFVMDIKTLEILEVTETVKRSVFCAVNNLSLEHSILLLFYCLENDIVVPICFLTLSIDLENQCMVICRISRDVTRTGVGEQRITSERMQHNNVTVKFRKV